MFKRRRSCSAKAHGTLCNLKLGPAPLETILDVLTSFQLLRVLLPAGIQLERQELQHVSRHLTAVDPLIVRYHRVINSVGPIASMKMQILSISLACAGLDFLLLPALDFMPPTPLTLPR